MTDDACTLPTEQRPLRRAEFDALFADSLQRAERLTERHLRLTLTGADDLEPRVRDLTAREQECCSFFTFSIDAPAPGRLRLDIEVPASRTTVLDGLAALATQARSGQPDV
jgi:hypothetical protein